MQCAVIEFARNVVGFEGANSSEIKSRYKISCNRFNADQKDIEDIGGTMRLGLYPCKLDEKVKFI